MKWDDYMRNGFLFVIIACIIVTGLLSTNAHGGGDDTPEGQENKEYQRFDWTINLSLSPDTPAKNQEVTLTVRVADSSGNPVSAVPLYFSLSSLTSLPEIHNMQFLEAQSSITDADGVYETIFNAPYFHSEGVGQYEIEVNATMNDVSEISAKRQFNVEEKVLEIRGIQIAEPAAPGTWYSMAIYDLDRSPLTVSIAQNDDNLTKIWTEEDWGKMGGMYEGGGDEEGMKAIYETYEASDDFARLWRCEGDSQILMDEYGYPAKTTVYSFLVTESSGEIIHVEIVGYIDGKKENISLDIPSIPLNRPSVGITYTAGEWFLKSSGGTGGTWQNDNIHIYGIGFEDKVQLTLTNDIEGDIEYYLESENKVVHFKWKVPKDAAIGYYYVTLEDQDQTGIFYNGNFGFYVAEAQEDLLLQDPEGIQKILGIIGISVLLLVISLSSYTRIKRKKILNHLTRKRIYEHIISNPGIHFRAILNDLDLKTGNLSYHLNVLEREEYLKSYQDGMYRRFNLYGKGQPLKISLSEIQERILLTIKNNPGINQSTIGKIIGSSRIVVNYHVRILCDVGMILIEKKGRETHCYNIQKAV